MATAKCKGKGIVRSKKSMYKTGIMICVAMVFVTFNIFIKDLPTGRRGGAAAKQLNRSSSNIAFNDVQTRYESGRKILWSDEGWYNDYEDAECRDIHGIDGMDEKCAFAEQVDDCQNSEGFFDYTLFVYCDIGSEAGGMVILIIWWLFCFVGLAVCADDFFCPSLVVISKTLHLSNNVAGVTFLAFGNGAPDLFSAIAALGDIEDGDSGLAVGGLFGAGMFVTTVVVGTIAVIKPFKAMERPFLRDATFYLCGVYWTFFVLWKGKMYFAEAIGFILSYFVYVAVVIASGSIYKKQKAAEEARKPKKDPDSIENILAEHGVSDGSTEMKAPAKVEKTPTIAKGDSNVASSNETITNGGSFKKVGEPSVVYGLENKAYTDDGGKGEAQGEKKDEAEMKPAMKSELSIYDNLGLSVEEIVTNVENTLPDLNGNNIYDNMEEEEEEEDIIELTPIQELLANLNPINTEEWGEMKVYEKVYEIFKSPIVFTITLTCPVVNYEDEVKNNWCRYLQCIQLVLGPPICLSLIGVGLTKIDGVFPVWALSMMIGACLAVLVFFTTKNDEKPSYHAVFGYAEFFIAIVWIYVIANEIVSLLQTFGIVFNISNAILGLTLLAWGNSIGDWIANSLMARQGFARMGFAACFGAPFFNLMLGFGLPLLIKMIQDGTSEVAMQITGVQLILSLFLMTNMIAVMIILVVIKFKMRKPVGIYLVIYYLVFLTTALLCETGVILEGWEPKRFVKDTLKDYYPD